MLAADCGWKERSKETKKKENKIISGTVVSGSRDRRHCATIIYMRGKTKSTHQNEVSVTPFFHQAPVLHILPSQGDCSDHALV